MTITVILGAQWGDEGKGRFTDALAHDARIVARFNGGDNAGHSITIGDKVVKLHMLPSGLFRQGCLSVIGNGCVVNPRNLLHEMADVRAAGVEINPNRLKISNSAHMILPGHLALDAAREATSAGLGTTKRGIGFAYMDKAKRSGIRAGAMAEPERFAESVYAHTVEVNKQLDREYGLPGVDATEAAGAYGAASQILKPYLADTLTLLNDALDDGQHVFAEGAQATLLDIDFGTYPYVTSSSASIGGVCTGLGVPPKFITRTVGVTKAFTTRVGAGPFPTELFGDMGTRLRGTGANAWDEFGATTGRARRVGWLDAVVLRYVVRLNGISELALTKLDILTGLDELKIAVGYKVDGGDTRAYPQDAEVLARCEPIFQTLPGWHQDVRGVRTFAGLPANCTAYLRAIEAATGALVTLASVGAERDQLILS